MTAKERASAIHADGFNCAQSVFAGCAQCAGIDENTAKAISVGFGGGMRCGEVCGAISGAVMAIGAAFSGDDASSPEAKANGRKYCIAFMTAVREKYGAVTCRELKSPEHLVPCDKLISECAELAENIINNNK